ncbi:MAG: hypothetical protein RR405_02300, partial [Clostridia bacterium]
ADGASKPKDDEIPPHVPYYSTLPRGSENFENISVAHIGGEDEETFENILVLGSATYCFFSSKSREFDVKEQGLYLAILQNGTLNSVKKIGDVGEHIADIKLSSNGIVAVTKSDENCKIYLFSASGALVAETKIDTFDSCILYLLNKELWLFSSTEKKLFATKISGDLLLEKSRFVYEIASVKVKAIMPQIDGVTLICESAKNSLHFTSFQPNTGFKLQNKLDKVSFMQIDTIRADNNINYILLCRQDNAFALFTLDDAFLPLAQKTIDGSGSACFFVSKLDITLFCKNTVLRFCRHLDLLSSSALPSPIIGDMLPISYFGDRYIAVKQDSAVNVFSVSPDCILTSIFADTKIANTPKFVATKDSLLVSYASSNNTGNAHMNFGKSDIFITNITLTK